MFSPNSEPPAPSCCVDEPHVRHAASVALNGCALSEGETPEGLASSPWLERASRVLTYNIAAGRFAYASRPEASPPLTFQEYANLVCIRLLAEWDRVEALRLGDAAHWAAIMQRLDRMAYYWLGPSGREAWATGEAREITAITCADVWVRLQQHPFPFDLPFDRWAEQFLRNRLLAAARNHRVQGRAFTHSLDQPVFEDGAAPVDLLYKDDMRDWLDREADCEWLQRALAQLDVRQQQIVRLWYLEGWSPEEIAAALDLQVGNVYVLKHRALRRMRSCRPSL